MLKLEQDTRPIQTTEKTKKRVTFPAENQHLTIIHEIPHLLDYSEDLLDELFYTEHELTYFQRDAQREMDNFVRQKADEALQKKRANMRLEKVAWITKQKKAWKQKRVVTAPRRPTGKQHLNKATRLAQAA